MVTPLPKELLLHCCASSVFSNSPVSSCLLQLSQVYHQFSSFLRKPTLHLGPSSDPASYNTRKGLDGMTSTCKLCHLGP